MDVNKLSGEVVDAATQVHKALGPGLLESTYEKLTGFELGLLINFNVSLLKDGIRRLTIAKPNPKPSVSSVHSVV